MTKRTKKILRIALISLVALFIILCGVIWYIANNLEKVVRYALIEEVKKNTDGLYTLEMGKLNINPTNGVLHINDIQLSIDSAKLFQLEIKGERPRYTTNFSASAIEINVNKFLSIRKNGELNVSHIAVLEPSIELFSSNVKTEHSIVEPAEKKQELKLPFFSSIVIEKFEVVNGNLSYYVQGEKDTAVYTTSNFSFHSNDIIASQNINLRNPFTHIKNAFLEVNNIRHFMLDSALLFTVKRVAANLKDSSVRIDSLAITPQYEKFEFAWKTPNHNDIIDLSIQNIALSGIHFNDLLNNNTLMVESITIDSLSFWSFKNKQIPPVASKVKPLFHKLVHRIKIPIYVDTIRVSNSNASYEELSLNGDVPGKIHFTDLFTEVIGLTNIITDKKQLYTVKSRGKIYGKNMIEATFQFPVDSLNDYFAINGHVGKMDLTVINSMVTPLTNIDIESGIVQRMDFSISGNSKTAKTNMTFLYNDLKVKLLNPKKENRSKRKLLSGVVNTLVIKSSNPSGSKEPRKVAGVTNERNRFLSNFNYWWRSVREGMVYSLGIPGKKQ